NFIIEAYISRWRMEMRIFSMGPPPAWLNDPPVDFLHLPPGSDRYANFSLTLMVRNNPHWLKAEVFSVQIRAFGQTLVLFRADGTAISEDGTLSFAERVPLADVSEAAYLCLRYLPNTDQLVAFQIYFEAEFTLFGHRSNAFVFATKVTDDASVGGNYRDDHKLSPSGEMIAQNCWKPYYSKASFIPADARFGEVIVLWANCERSFEFIPLDPLSSDRLRPQLDDG
ncbi:hypothetical protein FOZ63_009322, partial [Perkinsus olseni]